MTALLTVDAGQGGTRFELTGAGEPVRTDGPGVGLLSRGGDATVAAIVEQTWSRLGTPDLACISVGTTGWSRPPAHALAEQLRARTGARRVLVADDAVAAHLGALAGSDGVTVVAGTGVVALAVRGDQAAKVGGWGSAIDDEGGGHFVGRAGLQAAVRAWEAGRPGPLVDAARRRFGPYEDLRDALGDGSRATAMIAGFAVDLAALAAAGDDTAGAIWTNAAAAIAGLVQRSLARISYHADETVAVSVVGGLVDAGPVLLDPLDELLAALPRTRRSAPAGSVLDGARRMAASQLADPLREFVVELEDGCSTA